jgi:deoxyinosine 3'endonuclease (endonuclease V)
VLVDGCGVLHPRRCGSASQLGLAAGVPTIGVAKNLLAVEGLATNSVREAMRREQETGAAAAGGRQQAHAEAEERMRPVQPQRAQQAQQEPPSPAAAVLLSGSSGDVLGAAVCPSGIRRPIYVSVGHGLSLQTAVAVVRCCCRWIPAPGSSVQYR